MYGDEIRFFRLNKSTQVLFDSMPDNLKRAVEKCFNYIIEEGGESAEQLLFAVGLVCLGYNEYKPEASHKSATVN